MNKENQNNNWRALSYTTECLCCPKFIFWNLIPSVMVCGGGPWEVLKSWGWSPHDGISTLIRDPRELSLTFCHMKTQREGYLWTNKWGLTRHLICQPLGLWFIASRKMRNKYLMFKPSSLLYFTIEAQMDEDSILQTGSIIKITNIVENTLSLS